MLPYRDREQLSIPVTMYNLPDKPNDISLPFTDSPVSFGERNACLKIISRFYNARSRGKLYFPRVVGVNWRRCGSGCQRFNNRTEQSVSAHRCSLRPRCRCTNIFDDLRVYNWSIVCIHAAICREPQKSEHSILYFMTDRGVIAPPSPPPPHAPPGSLVSATGHLLLLH